MTAKHTGASFNHSCLKVPVNPTNRLPVPSFERKRHCNTFSNGYTGNSINKEMSRKTIGENLDDLRSTYRPSSSDSREERSKASTPQHDTCSVLNKVEGSANTENLKSFLDFYESIPDYGDLNHLSDRDFYIRLKNLKAKHKSYLKDLDTGRPTGNNVDTLEVIEENKVNTVRNIEGKDHVSTPSPKHYNNLNLHGKKCDIDSKTPTPGSFTYQARQKKYLDSCDSAFWDKLDRKNYISPSPTVSAISLDGPHKEISRNNPKPSIQLNNYLLDIDEADTSNKLRVDLFSKRSFGKENKIRSPLPHGELYKVKAKKPNTGNGTNKMRDTHTFPLNKSGTADSCSSFNDSMWDGFIIDEYIPNPDLFSDSDSAHDDRLDIPLSRSMPSSPSLKQNKNVAWREPKITVPKPFHMTLREEEDRHINLLRYQLYGSDTLDEPKDESNIIRANPVPLESQLPLFDKIMAEQENRRRHVRRQCMNELRAQMKPFKFVKRDEERKRLRLCRSSPDLRELGDLSPKSKPFKARPVPKNLFSSYVYQRMIEDEYYRSLKKKIRAEELLKASSLPPSMAARERRSKAKALSAEVLNNDSDSRPKRRKHKIPNYKKSHEQMRIELEDRWNDNITTSPQPFTLRTAELHKRKSARFTSPDHSSTSSPYELYPSSVCREHIRPHSAIGIPLNRNNLASVLRIQSSRQRIERELALRQEEIRRKEEMRLKSHVARRKPVWQALSYSTEEDLAMRIQTRREEERIRREDHERDMQLMLNRVERIPTLFERQSQVSSKEINRRDRKSRSKSGHHTRISSIPTTPDLYEEDEGEESKVDESEIPDDKNLKMGLKVSISETPETIECPSEPEDVSRNGNSSNQYKNGRKYNGDKNEQNASDTDVEKNGRQDRKESRNVEEKEEESENTESIQEDISAGRKTDGSDDDDDDDEDDDDENENTYTIVE